jgi:RNA polymerase sigma factor (sigma-70 family)
MSLLRTNRALLDRFRAGDPDALSAVYWGYVRKVERLLSAGFEIPSRGARVAGVCQHPDALADLVQDVFLRAFSEKGRRSYDGLRDYGPFLYAIARNALVDWARLRGREIPAPWNEIEAALDVAPILEETAPWATPTVMRLVEDYLAGLPNELREVHRLRHQECLSQDQAAERLGVGRQTLRTLERRLRDGLEALLHAEGYFDDGQPKSTEVRSDHQQAPRYEATER